MMLYLGIHIGDSTRDIELLTNEEVGMYHRLMVAYVCNEGPLPNHRETLFGICKAINPQTQKAAHRVLERHFPEDQGYRHNRLAEDAIGRYFKNRSKSSKAATVRWAKVVDIK